MSYFGKNFWSGSEITVTVFNALSIPFYIYWFNKTKEVEKKTKEEGKKWYYILYAFISILILVLYYVLKYKEILPVGECTNIGYFAISLYFLIVFPATVKYRKDCCAELNGYKRL
jgi:hypothetical protein